MYTTKTERAEDKKDTHMNQIMKFDHKRFTEDSPYLQEDQFSGETSEDER